MKVICSGCKKDMGEKEGPEDKVSHSTCPTCAEIARKGIEEYLEKEAEDAVQG